MEQKFKVGDKVKSLEGEGKIVYIAPEGDDKYLVDLGPTFRGHKGTAWNHGLDLSPTCYWYKEEQLTLLGHQFTKADLKVGMLIELRDGTLDLLALDKKDNLIGITIRNHYLDLQHLDDDLTNSSMTGPDDLDVMVVYDRPVYLGNLLKYDTTQRDVLWARPKPVTVKEMTVAEISAKLGYDVKVVK